jgi:hypothetical protein
VKILYAELQDRIKDKEVKDKCQAYLRTLIKTIMGLTQRRMDISKRLIDDYITLSLLLECGIKDGEYFIVPIYMFHNTESFAEFGEISEYGVSVSISAWKAGVTLVPDLQYVRSIIWATEYEFKDEYDIIEDYKHHKRVLNLGMKKGSALSTKSVDLMIKGMIMQGKLNINPETGIWTLDVSDFSFRFLSYLGQEIKAFKDTLYTKLPKCYAYMPSNLIDSIGLEEITEKEG